MGYSVNYRRSWINFVYFSHFIPVLLSIIIDLGILNLIVMNIFKSDERYLKKLHQNN